MKAAVFKGVDRPLTIDTVADPTPEADELVLKVAYCGICGTDLHATREGIATVPCDSILGHEFVGEVVDGGAHTREHWRAGERVCALPFLACGRCPACVNGRPFQCSQRRLTGLEVPGGFADYVKTHASATLRLPDALAFERAALIEPLAVALHAVRVAGLQAGQRVLILGAGPVGLAVALWANTLGAAAVVVSEPASGRRALAAKLGATALIEPGENLAEQMRDAAGGDADIIFECVGAPGMLQHCVDIAAFGSRIVPVGVCEQPDSFMPFIALTKELRIQFAIAYSRDDFLTAMQLLAQGRIDASAMVTDTVPLESMPPVFEALRSPGEQCKVLVAL